MLKAGGSFIGHWDGDAFFASVEQAADRRLRGLPVVVGGGRRGVVASASYEARHFGIHSAMPVYRARQLCPSLVVVRGHYELYEQFSDYVFNLCHERTPLVERTSVDEGYMDLRGTGAPAAQLMKELDIEISRALKITVSMGLASNRLVAQVAGKSCKPHGFVEVAAGEEEAFMAPLSLSRLPGLGPRTVERLQGVGLFKLGDLQRAGVNWLTPILGRQTAWVLAAARGEGDAEVRLERAPAQSFGEQHSFDDELESEAVGEQWVKRALDNQLRRLREHRQHARGMMLALRYSDGEEVSGSVRLVEPSDLAEDFYPHAGPLLRRLWRRRVRVRRLRLSLGQLYPAITNGDLFDSSRDRIRRLAQVTDQLNAAFGHAILQRAVHL